MYGIANVTSLGIPMFGKIVVLDRAVNNAKQTEMTEIHSTVQAPATIIAKAKKPNPAVLPPKV